MDENKRLKLHEIGYKLIVTCGTCKFGNFRSGYDFGDCDKHKYQHLKHSVGEKPLSIFKYATCRDGVFDPDRLQAIHGFKEFLPCC